MGHQASERLDAVRFCKLPGSNDHCRCAAAEAGCVSGGDAAILAESGPQFRQDGDRRLRAERLVLTELLNALAALDLDRNDLGRKLAFGLSRAEALLGTLRPAV